MLENEPTPAALPPVIPRKLREFERARNGDLALRAVAEALIVLGLGVLAVALVEGLTRSSLAWRVVLSAMVEGAAGLWLLGGLGRAWLRRGKIRDLARDFENAAGFADRERIWSAVELAGIADGNRGLSRWMVDQTVALAVRQIESVHPRSLIDHGPLARSWKRAAAVAGLISLGVVAGAAGRLRLAVNPYAPTVALSRIQFTVTPGDCSVTEGTNLVVTVAASRLPQNGKLVVTWADGGHESIALNRTGTNLFQSEIPGVAQSFKYQVLAEESESPVYAAQVVFAPRLARLQVTVQPPAYTGWTNQITESGSAEFIEGSKVTVELSATREKVDRAEFISDAGTTQQFLPADSRLRLGLEPTNSVNYGIRLVGENKLVSETAPDNRLNPRPDLPPTASLTAEGLGYGLVERDEVLPFSIQTADDVGLQRVDLVILSANLQRETRNLFDARTNSPLPGKAGLRDFSVSPNFNLSELHPNPGDELQFLVVATDLKGQTNESSPVSLTIGSLEKSLEARLAARLKLLLDRLQNGSEDLKAARTSWLAQGRNYREQDRAASAETMALVKSRVTGLEREIDRIGNALVNESKTNAVQDARFIYRLGLSLSAWAREQGGVLRREMGRLDEAPLDTMPAIFDRGSDLLNLASADLTNFTHVVAVLQGALETDVLATRCEMAQGRYKRAFPVLRGEAKATADGFADAAGLEVTFFEGIELGGRVIERKVDVPDFENATPGGRGEQWSCRYEGQINIVDAGDWTFACLADDGVRLKLDGASLLPAAAWSAHPATEYRADVNLRAGWHPIVIEFFQGSSLSKLQFLMGRKSKPLQEVPAFRLRPRAAPEVSKVSPANQIPAAETVGLVRERLAASLATAATVPPTLATITNAVAIGKLSSLVADGGAIGVTLSNSLATVVSWPAEANAAAESGADELTALSLEARRILREELDRTRWRYEGAEALKNVQTAIEELRAVNDQLRHLPWNDRKQLDEQEQAQVNIAKVWEKELERATTEAARNLFEQARQKDATLAERTWALNASAKTTRELAPAVAKLAPKLEQNRSKNEMGDEIDRRLNEISDRYRELNDMQERINREHVAGVARAALPAVRALARSQTQANDPAAAEKFEDARREAEKIAEAERVTGDYQTAIQLETLVGDSPAAADGPKLATKVRDLASQTDRNPPSLAQTIPPPMQKETSALAAQQETGAAAADQLAIPRLAMSLEASRLSRKGDRKVANAYELLGEDLGQAINAPDQLNDKTLQPLTDRALALAGAKGDEARQAEIKAAEARVAQMAANRQTPAALANELESLSSLALDATKDAAKDAPLLSRLDTLGQLAPPVRDWSESTDPAEVAASAAHESEQGLEAAPKSWEAHSQASEILADAARQLRMDAALHDLAGRDPFPAPPESGPPSADPSDQPDRTTKLDGATGKALTQAIPRGADQAEWARLNDLLRKRIRNGGAENFTEEQRAAINAYFEKLGSAK